MNELSARIRATLQGDVDASDLREAIAATRPLYDLRQRLDDLRLEREVAGTGPWPITLECGPIAAPLWLADLIVAVAQSIVDAANPAGADGPVLMGRHTREHALALLALVGPILIETGARLADPAHIMALSMPLTLGLDDGGYLRKTLNAVPLDPIYLRGLLRAADYAQGAATMPLGAAHTMAAERATPRWVGDVVAAVSEAPLAAAAIRLDSARARCAPLLHDGKVGQDTLYAVIPDLWRAIDAYSLAAQVALYPYLGAPGRTPAADVALPPQSPEQAAPPTIPAPTIPAPTIPAPPPPPQPAVSTVSPSSGPLAGRAFPVEPEGGVARRVDPALWNARAPYAAPRPDEAAPATATTAALTSNGRRRARHVAMSNRWMLSAPRVQEELRVAGRLEAGEAELERFWTERDWALYADEQEYILAVDALLRGGDVAPLPDHGDAAPFAPVYQVEADSVEVAGATIGADGQFTYNHVKGRVIVV